MVVSNNSCQIFNVVVVVKIVVIVTAVAAATATAAAAAAASVALRNTGARRRHSFFSKTGLEKNDEFVHHFNKYPSLLLIHVM